jgi:very-short-patch-repair endonuclease
MSGRRSALELVLENRIARAGLPAPVLEFQFSPPRRWRFDFCWVDQRLAAEAEGGAYSGGRHTRGAGFEADAEKYNCAVLRGWRVVRFTRRMIEDGTAVETLRAALGGAEGA